MDLLTILIIAVGLAMDCLAVSVAQGIAVQPTDRPKPLLMALLFGLFQGGMPLISYYAGSLFAAFFTRWSPWIALVLLCLIGGKMLWEAYKERNGQEENADTGNSILGIGTMLLLSIATSIDALSIGVLFIPVPEVLWRAVAVIACTSTFFSVIGYALGKTLGKHLPFNANIIGGIILIAIGIKICLEGVLL
jgi:putative Mn2+ efflux pump MntP